MTNLILMPGGTYCGSYKKDEINNCTASYHDPTLKRDISITFFEGMIFMMKDSVQDSKGHAPILVIQ